MEWWVKCRPDSEPNSVTSCLCVFGETTEVSAATFEKQRWKSQCPHLTVGHAPLHIFWNPTGLFVLSSGLGVLLHLSDDDLGWQVSFHSKADLWHWVVSQAVWLLRVSLDACAGENPLYHSSGLTWKCFLCEHIAFSAQYQCKLDIPDPQFLHKLR